MYHYKCLYTRIMLEVNYICRNSTFSSESNQMQIQRSGHTPFPGFTIDLTHYNFVCKHQVFWVTLVFSQKPSFSTDCGKQFSEIPMKCVFELTCLTRHCTSCDVPVLMHTLQCRCWNYLLCSPKLHVAALRFPLIWKMVDRGIYNIVM